MPFLHGSQGCATYMRRYIIRHYNEPIDIASSSLSEKHAVYGGGPNLKLGLTNVTEKYRPAVIGLATTCLTETIGDLVSHPNFKALVTAIGFVGVNDVLETARAAMASVPNCNDLFVTSNGTATGAVQGWLTNTDLAGLT